MDYIIKKFDDLTNRQLYELLRLRIEIFVVEQNCAYQDLDLKDYPSYHLLAMDGDVIAGYLRIIPQNIAFRDVAIGRVIVMKKYRGRAISREMMTKAMQFIKDDLKKDKIRLSGQAYLSDFYISLGFKRVSELYLEDGIEHYEFLYDGNDLNEH